MPRARIPWDTVSLSQLVELATDCLGEPESVEHRTHELFVALRNLGWRGQLRHYTMTVSLPATETLRAVNTGEWVMLRQGGAPEVNAAGATLDQVIEREARNARARFHMYVLPDQALRAWNKTQPRTTAGLLVDGEEVERITPILASRLQDLTLQACTPQVEALRRSMRL